MKSSELDWLDSLQGSGIRPGIGRMRMLLRAAGRPERNVPAIIVAGTNGKGSTASLLASIFSASGLRAGLYTSPHLVRIEERWKIDGVDVSSAMLVEAIRRLRVLSNRSTVTPTYFEAVTMLAFLLFDAHRCDVSVLEVGMGGRLDATNVIRPIASLVTPVALDHMEYLGPTIRAIAREKAGVIHRGAIVLTSSMEPAVIDVIAKRTRKVGGVGPFVVLTEASATRPRISRGRSRFQLSTPRGSYAIDTSLPGLHQVGNVALAVRAAEELSSRFPSIDAPAIVRGVRMARWRGRLERFEVGEREIWVDGAHNPAGAEAIASFVDANLGRPRTLVLGVLSDKDVAGVIRVLAPRFDDVVLTEPRSERAARVDDLRRILMAGPCGTIRVRRRVGDAIRLVLEDGERGPIVVCGSLYVAGEATATLDRILRSRLGCGTADHRE